MKVWQLIAELSMYPAGKEVQVSPLTGDYTLEIYRTDDADSEDPDQAIILSTRKANA